MAPLYISYLTKYLIYERTDEYKEWFPGNDEPIEVELTFDEYLSKYNLNDNEEEEIDLWKGNKLPWNGLACLAVVCYAVKLNKENMHDTIIDLDWIALYYHREKKYNLGNQLKIREKLSSLFVNTFIPMAREIFNVPKLNELLEKDISLKPNEILASFLEFLLQLLNSEALLNSDKEHQYYILQKELTFLLSILGDMPFQYTELGDVNNLLGEIEALANEAGNFIYSRIFTLHPVADQIFNEGQCAVSEMAEILNIKIKQHCIKFSVENSSVISPTNEVIDSIFIVDSLIEDLENMMNYQIHLIVDELDVQIMRLQDELKISRSLLKDIASHTIHMDELNESMVQVRDVAYEAEYLVNSYVVGNLHLWYFNLRLPVVISKFKLITTRLQQVKNIHDIEVLDIRKDFEREVPTQDIGTSTFKTIDNVVGFEAEIANMSDALCGREKSRQIISIIGMPGLGKTTIANKLFHDPLVRSHFDERGHCVVAQTYQKRKVLIDILMSFSKSKTEKKSLSQLEDEDLSLRIHQCLMGRRYLIYLDDVWSIDVWYDLQRYFPDHEGNGGSRIMLTSRINGISPIGSIVYSLPLLTTKQSWRLLEMKVFPKESSCPPQLQSIGKRIATKCGGLPLAVVVTGGVLTNTENNESLWEKVEINLDSYMFSDGTNDYSKVLELSFTHLPNHLKMCFLYIGAFPEDAQIQVKKLIRLWISEGFIQREQGKSRQLVAEGYLKDLINRNLILVAERKSDGRIKTCSIHDQLRVMCLRKSLEEIFSKSVDDQYFSIYEKHRRVFNNYKHVGWESYGLYYRSFSGYLGHSSSKLPQMKLLRVIDLLPGPDSCNINELKKVYLEVQVRYLAINQMPNLKHDYFVNLEFLVICSKKVVKIPLFILKLVKLRHLDIGSADFEEDCYSCQSTNLRYFSKIRIGNEKDNKILRRSQDLHKLKCYYFNPTLFPDLHSHHDLQILKMQFHCYFSGELTKVNIPSTITHLSLMGLGLPWEEISMIGKLPNLRVLRLGYHAFVGEKWVTRDEEFQELRYLLLGCNDTIKEWITCSEHFPQLECLIVRECINLKEIPNEIGYIDTLKLIKVIESGDGACKSAVEIVEEQRDQYGNELLQLQTSNELKMEDLVQKFQERKLKIQEYRLENGY